MRTETNTLVKLLQAEKLTLALAESVTSGLVSHQFSTVKGTMDIFRGAIVCYHPDVKTRLLGVSNSLLKKYTPESQQVTDELAKKLRQKIEADIHAAVTGISSAGGSETKVKPVGTVFFSVLFKKKLYRKRQVFRGSPQDIRDKACIGLLRFILSIAKDEK
jgi:nicotinamide-nucleotide amidase